MLFAGKGRTSRKRVPPVVATVPFLCIAEVSEEFMLGVWPSRRSFQNSDVIIVLMRSVSDTTSLTMGRDRETGRASKEKIGGAKRDADELQSALLFSSRYLC